MRKSRGILLVAFTFIVLVIGAIWKFVETDKCLDAGGMVVGSFMREQSCVMERSVNSRVSSSRP